ncbi:FAD-dependent oxidoreductase [Chloroflexota bacterium]
MLELNKILEKCTGSDLPFCQAACPLHVDMKGAIGLIRDGKFDEALKLIRETLPFPGILGRVCTHPCEEQCYRNEVDELISIMALKRSAADYGEDDGEDDGDLTIAEEKKERIAVVGGGPAGLMAAYELRRMGYQVTIFEALPVLGGMLATGIPAYRLPRDVMERELGIIEKMGVQVKLNARIGDDIKISDLKKDYNAVFIAAGAQLSRRFDIGGSELNGVRWGLDFLREVNLGRKVDIKDRVLVVGGGNVAIDVALTALRVGAKEVQLACLESREEMPAFEWEIQQALEEGVKVNVSWGPKRILGGGNGVKGIEMVRCTRVFDATGGFNPSFDESVTTTIDTDMVILAIGQAPDVSFLGEDSQIKCSNGGYIIANETNLETGVPGIFAGGDVVSGPKSIIEALAAGRKAAISIVRYLKGEDLTVGREDEGPVASQLKVNIEGVARKKRTGMPTLPVSQRKGNFREVELGYSKEKSIEEAERCLSCECKLCVKDCEFLQLYCQTPKELAEKFNAGYFREKPVIPYSCNLCELCKEVCPEDLCSGDMCLEIREKMVGEGIGPLPPHQFVRRDQEYATSDAFALSIPGSKDGNSEWAFFPGCALSAHSPELVINVYHYLREKLPGTGIILRCCGAPTHCLGDHPNFKGMVDELEAEVKKMGASGLILACADCYRTIKRNAPGLKLKSVYEVILEQGLPEGAKAATPGTFSLHDSCTARDEPELMASVRALVQKMGYRIEEMEYSREKTRCCGAGGMIPYVDPKLFSKLAKRRADEAPYDLLTFCAACRETFASVGKPSVHILELIFNPEWAESLRKPPQTGKVRREKQAELKNTLTAGVS